MDVDFLTSLYGETCCVVIAYFSVSYSSKEMAIINLLCGVFNFQDTKEIAVTERRG